MGGRTKDGDMIRRGKGDIDRMIERWEREPVAVSLPDSTVELAGVRREGNGTRVRALVPMETHYIESINVEGEVITWTSRAVLVRAVLQEGKRH